MSRQPQRYNSQSINIRRIMSEVKEFARSPSSQFTAQPLASNLFEWHFSIRGSGGTDFDGGVYHGRILLPPEYPFKPPNIVFLTPNGRFETHKKICLTVSAYHPESWKPSWSIRTVLLAIVGFMPTPGNGAIGALDCDSETRKRLALKSQSYVCDTCGADHSVILPKGDSAEDSDAAAVAKEVAQALQDIKIDKIEDLPESTSSEDEDEDVHVEGKPGDVTASASPSPAAAVVTAEPSPGPVSDDDGDKVIPGARGGGAVAAAAVAVGETHTPARQVTPPPPREVWKPIVEPGLGIDVMIGIVSLAIVAILVRRYVLVW